MDKVDYEAKLAAEVQNLANYRKAFEEELNKQNNKDPLVDDLDKQEVMHSADQKLLSLVPVAVEKIHHLLQYAEKDSTQFTIAKFLIDRFALISAGEGTTDDPLEVLIKQLTANDNTD